MIHEMETDWIFRALFLIFRIGRICLWYLKFLKIEIETEEFYLKS